MMLELALEKEKYFQNYLFFAKKIKKEVKKCCRSAQVLIFGSILRKNEVARDIDVLIVTPQKIDLRKKREILEKIHKKIGFFHPFEFHFATKEEFKKWYSHFIKKYKKV